VQTLIAAIHSGSTVQVSYDVAGILGTCLILFGLVARSTGLMKSRRDSDYSQTAVWFIPVLSRSDNHAGRVFRLVDVAAYLLINGSCRVVGCRRL